MCGSFLGGVAEFTQTGFEGMSTEFTTSTPITVEVDDAPTEMLMGWLKLKLAEDNNFKAVVFSRFVPEIQRLVARLEKAHIPYGQKWGGESDYRNELHPRSGSPRAFHLGLSASDRSVR